MKNPKVIRPGDTVKIIDPRFVTRCGYPLCADDLMVEAEATLVEKGLVPVRQRNYRDGGLAERRRDEHNFIRKYAVLLLRKKGWGGDMRSLHFIDMPEHKDLVVKVNGKRIVQTGERVGPTTSRSSGWDGDDYDYDPGGLNDRKTHMLLSIRNDSWSRFALGRHFDNDYDDKYDPNWGKFPLRNWSKLHHDLVIPAAHVVKLPDGSQD